MRYATDEQLRAMPFQRLARYLSVLWKLADLSMRRYCAGSTGALKFGWDWPTFSALYPEQAVEIRRVKAEGRSRPEYKAA